MNNSFLHLRNEYPEFVYEDFNVIETEIEYKVTYIFRLKELTFKPVITISKKHITNKDIDKEYLNYLFFHYGLFDLMSYYKLTCSPKIIIKPMFIDSNQCSFFKKVLFNGLGEYFYKNSINLSYDEFLDISVESDKKYNLPTFVDNYKGNIIPIGGGKDSIVSMELLKNYHDYNKLFMLERNLYPENKAGYESIYKAGYNDSSIVLFKNELDLQLIELNKKGFLNGHIPISACISMASFILAYLNNKKYIVLSNEASANEGNFEGLSVNHQYSKGYEYEADFQNYSRTYLHPYIFYFSLLRGWNEYEIVREFLKEKKYLSVFRSCNRGTKENIWCNHCSKCLYVYIMLYPYLTDEEMKLVFDNDMLDDPSLEDTFLDLILPSRLKPFECVGTRLEINYALQMALKNKDKYPYLLKLYKEKYFENEINKDLVENFWNNENSIPEEYLVLFGDKNER
ncbi:MAG: hypothetical protein IKH54_04605 [Bacilli bacterium]|nr:hypothetical protein [Bacilli bacterium]